MAGLGSAEDWQEAGEAGVKLPASTVHRIFLRHNLVREQVQDERSELRTAKSCRTTSEDDPSLVPQARAQRSEARIKNRSSSLLVRAFHGLSQVAVESCLIAFALLLNPGENVASIRIVSDFLIAR